MSQNNLKVFRYVVVNVALLLFIFGNGIFGQTPPFRLPSEISTSDGVTYKGVELLSVKPDGLFVNFRPSGGGMGMATLKFKNLPEDICRQYGYDPEKARDYEAKQERGRAELVNEMRETFKVACKAAAIHREESYKELKRQQEQRVEMEKERMRLEQERKMAAAQMEQERELAKIQAASGYWYSYSDAGWNNGYADGVDPAKPINIQPQITPTTTSPLPNSAALQTAYNAAVTARQSGQLSPSDLSSIRDRAATRAVQMGMPGNLGGAGSAFPTARR
jgi:hypothetical protein